MVIRKRFKTIVLTDPGMEERNAASVVGAGKRPELGGIDKRNAATTVWDMERLFPPSSPLATKIAKAWSAGHVKAAEGAGSAGRSEAQSLDMVEHHASLSLARTKGLEQQSETPFQVVQQADSKEKKEHKKVR